MNLLIRNVQDLSSSFYLLKHCLTDYFLAIAGGENSQIVKFYGANVNPDLLKTSINNLFSMLLEKYDLMKKLISAPKEVHLSLVNDLIYNVIIKKYQFYCILIRYDVQTNYLHTFMVRQLENLDRTTVSIE